MLLLKYHSHLFRRVLRSVLRLHCLPRSGRLPEAEAAQRLLQAVSRLLHKKQRRRTAVLFRRCTVLRLQRLYSHRLHTRLRFQSAYRSFQDTSGLLYSGYQRPRCRSLRRLPGKMLRCSARQRRLLTFRYRHPALCSCLLKYPHHRRVPWNRQPVPLQHPQDHSVHPSGHRIR